MRFTPTNADSKRISRNIYAQTCQIATQFERFFIGDFNEKKERAVLIRCVLGWSVIVIALTRSVSLLQSG